MTLPTNRTNSTLSQDNHPQDHNDVNEAVNNLVEQFVPIVFVTQSEYDAINPKDPDTLYVVVNA